MGRRKGGKPGRQSFRPPHFTERLEGLIGGRVVTTIEENNPDLPRGQLGRWARGETFPTYENMLILERIFEVPWEWLVVGEQGARRLAEFEALAKKTQALARSPSPRPDQPRDVPRPAPGAAKPRGRKTG